MGSKGQLPLDFFESVGICDGAPSNVFKFTFEFDFLALMSFYLLTPAYGFSTHIIL